jgi:hypothetical protein
MTDSHYYIFTTYALAAACSRAIHCIGRPEHLFPNDVTARYSLPIQLLDGRAALPLDMDGSIILHKESAASGSVEVLIRNLNGPPNETDLANWAGVTAALDALPLRGAPSLNGLEPVLAVPLAALMPSGAVEGLMTMEDLIAEGLVVDPNPIDPNQPEEPAP